MQSQDEDNVGEDEAEEPTLPAPVEQNPYQPPATIGFAEPNPNLDGKFYFPLQSTGFY